MSLLHIVRNAVKIADKVTKPLQGTVLFHRRTTADSYGAESTSGTVALRAIVEYKQQQVRSSGGVLSVSRASVIFLDVAALLSATANNGIDTNDSIILPDGTTGPILDISGFVDAGTEQPVATEVLLG